jgi:hypothetical protein
MNLAGNRQVLLLPGKNIIIAILPTICKELYTIYETKSI